MLNHKKIIQDIKEDLESIERLNRDTYTLQRVRGCMQKVSYLKDMLEGYETFTHIIEKQEKQS